MQKLPILYQDELLVAVNKPAGLLVHRSFADPHETAFALQLLRDQLGRRVYPFHRLDRATSGVLLFALHPDTARTMTDAFAGREVEKSYLAVVRGYTDEAGRIEHPLTDPGGRLADPRAKQNKPPKEAVTEYRRLATVELEHAVGRYASARFSLIEARPLTGRTHQVRRHLKHLFHPVIGDTTYGDGKQNVFFREQFACARLLLHARRVSFPHPEDGRRVQITATLDEAFGAILRELGWEGAVPEAAG